MIIGGKKLSICPPIYQVQLVGSNRGIVLFAEKNIQMIWNTKCIRGIIGVYRVEMKIV